VSDYYQCLSPIGADTTPGRIYEIAETTFQRGWYWLRDDTGKALHIGGETLAEKFTPFDYEEQVAGILAREMEDRIEAQIGECIRRMATSGESMLSCSEIADSMGRTPMDLNRDIQKFRRILGKNLGLSHRLRVCQVAKVS